MLNGFPHLGQIDYETVTNEVIADTQTAREVLGDMPELVSQLMRTGMLEVKQMRWTDVQVFNLIEMMTSELPYGACYSSIRYDFEVFQPIPSRGY